MHHGRKVRDRCAALRQDQQQKLRGAVYHDHGLRFLCLVRELALAHPWHDSDAPGLVRRLLGYVIPPARSARNSCPVACDSRRFSICEGRPVLYRLPFLAFRSTPRRRHQVPLRQSFRRWVRLTSMTLRPRCSAWPLVSSSTATGALACYVRTTYESLLRYCFAHFCVGEYRLLNTMITSEMRKDPDGEGANWDVLYTTIEKVISRREA